MTLPKQAWEPDRTGPLAGVRVLDFSRLVAGNMLSLQLADFGAEVIKVETPGSGDTLRDWREEGDQRPLEGVRAQQEEHHPQPEGARGARLIA